MARTSTFAALALALVACGSSTMKDPCESAPTYTNDVRPIVVDKCLPCHSSALVGSARMGAPDGYDFDTYESTRPNMAAFADAITSGREPPPEANLPTTITERETVSRWRSCDFKQ